MFTRQEKMTLDSFFQRLKLRNSKNESGKDKAAKIEQILAYLEIIHSQIRKYSKKRTLVFIESGAGNSYLSFLVYYYYVRIDKRSIAIYCLDINKRLMDKAQRIAREFQFDHLFFHACDIAKFGPLGHVDMVYSLHACDSATDKTLHLGLRQNATYILSVACCQHMIRRQLKGHPYVGITRHRVFKEKIVYMVGDALRALLLEMRGYKVDILEFVSSRYTDKNAMIRARKGPVKNTHRLQEEYIQLRNAFNVTPSLEKYLEEEIQQ